MAQNVKNKGKNIRIELYGTIIKLVKCYGDLKPNIMNNFLKNS